MPCNNCALIRVVFFFASCTLKKCAVLPKQLRRVSGAEEYFCLCHTINLLKQLRRVSGVNNYHKILTIII